MNRLMKAEWYRARKSSGIMKWLFIISIFLLAITFMEYDSAKNITASSYLLLFEENVAPLILLFMTVIAALFAGMPFNNKTALYEVMAGNKPSKIILSKLLVVVPLVSIVFTGLVVIVTGVLQLANGTGELKQMPLRLLILFVAVVHISTISVLAVTAVRSILGIGIAFLRFAVFDSALIILIQVLIEDSYDIETVRKVCLWFTGSQITSLGMETIPSYFIVAAIAGFVIEAVIWYVISYIGYRRRKFQ